MEPTALFFAGVALLAGSITLLGCAKKSVAKAAAGTDLLGVTNKYLSFVCLGTKLAKVESAMGLEKNAEIKTPATGTKQPAVAAKSTNVETKDIATITKEASPTAEKVPAVVDAATAAKTSNRARDATPSSLPPVQDVKVILFILLPNWP